jgi:peptidoglycan/LPS O-acetylase OafA/YrhL
MLNFLHSINPVKHTGSLDVLKLLDFCKGLAILSVVLFHYNTRWFGWQGVHLFIVLSGFGLTYSCLLKQRQIFWRDWYVKRFERIFPSYWAVVTFTYICLLVLRLFFREQFSFSLRQSTTQFILDFLLLRNFSYQTMLGYPNDALWFVPLILSLYLVFPYFYRLLIEQKQSIWAVLLMAIGIEFLYRGIAIYGLDGFPVAYGNGFLGNFSMNISPLNRWAEDSWFQFQLWSPFGWFPARLAEFVFGMVAAVACNRDSQKFKSLAFTYQSAITGVVIWLVGSGLIYAGCWGWIFADLLIAIGLSLAVVNLAVIIQLLLPNLFLGIEQLGKWSYYIFLTHLVFMYAFIYPFMGVQLATKHNFFAPLIIQFSTFLLTLTITGVATWSLMQLEQGRYRLWIRALFSKLLSTNR